MNCCPECNSSKVCKNGLRYIQGKPIQRYLCCSCGYRFSENRFKESQTIIHRQICVLDKKMKNLARAEKVTALQKHNGNTKSNLINFSWYLKKLGRSEATIRTYTNYVKNIGKLADLNDPEAVKGVIATHYKDKNTQRMACCSYDAYLNFKGGKWEKPHYKPEHKQTFIPTQEELQLAINTGHKENFVFSKFLYETGARSNEAQRLEWTDLDPESNQVTIKASKNGNARTIEIPKDLIDLLSSLPKQQNQKTVFTPKPRNTRSSSFHNRMKRLSKIYNNPRFTKIHFHTFRHCKALRVYHNSHEILEVMEFLGTEKSKQLTDTLAYTDKFTKIANQRHS
jgi:integrase